MTVQEMRTDRIERNRPFIFVEFSFSGSGAIYFVMRNTGTNIARNISLKFDPSPINFAGDKFTDMSLFQTPIPIIGPNNEHKFGNNILDAVT